MKREIDSNGRLLYKFSHSVAQGGNAFIQKTLNGKSIENKQRLRDVLNEIALQHKLIDPTIKIYDTIFFFFFHIPRTLAPLRIFESIDKDIIPLDQWDEDHIFTGVYDLQEKFLRKDLEKWGYEYDKG